MPQKTTIVIYTNRITNRLRYVCRVIFQNYLKIPYILSEVPIIKEDVYLIEYNPEPNGKLAFIPFEGLIYEEGSIRSVMPEVHGDNDQRILFSAQNHSENAILDFDIFSAVFFCLSLYQAYIPLPKDQHERIDYQHWHIRKTGLDQYPFVEIWIQKLREHLMKAGFHLPTNPVKGADISIDIDHFFAFTNRSIGRHIKGFLGDVLRFNSGRFIERAKSISGIQKDPYEGFFTWLEQQHQRFTFFVLMKEGGKDSLNPNNPNKQARIQTLKQYGDVGIHPSYESSVNTDRISEEIHLLENVLQEKISMSRQHFLRWKAPDTFDELCKNGIQHDYSLGYYDQPGFMCATSSPFPFYHLKQEVSTELTLHPFCWMDSMNEYYRKINAQKAMEEVLSFKYRANAAYSRASFVFHNDNLISDKYKTIVNALSDC